MTLTDEIKESGFVICWVQDGAERWHLVYGRDAADIYISDLVDAGVDPNDILFFDGQDAIE